MKEEEAKTCTFEGYLHKGGKNFLVQYPKRYFRVLGDALFWYKSKEDPSPLGDVLLGDITGITVRLKNKEGLPFDIESGKRTLNLVAPTQSVLDYWLTAIGSGIEIKKETDQPSNTSKDENSKEKESSKDNPNRSSIFPFKQKNNKASEAPAESSPTETVIPKLNPLKISTSKPEKSTEKPNSGKSEKSADKSSTKASEKSETPTNTTPAPATVAPPAETAPPDSTSPKVLPTEDVVPEGRTKNLIATFNTKSSEPISPPNPRFASRSNSISSSTPSISINASSTQIGQKSQPQHSPRLSSSPTSASATAGFTPPSTSTNGKANTAAPVASPASPPPPSRPLPKPGPKLSAKPPATQTPTTLSPSASTPISSNIIPNGTSIVQSTSSSSPNLVRSNSFRLSDSSSSSVSSSTSSDSLDSAKSSISASGEHSRYPKPLPSLPPRTPSPIGAELKNSRLIPSTPPRLSSPSPDIPEISIDPDESEEYAGYTTVCYATARSEFSGEGEVGSVLSLTAGMVIGVVEQGEDGWWLGYPVKTMEPLGYFPGSYVDVMTPAEESLLIPVKLEDKKKKNSALSLSISVSDKAAADQKRGNLAKEILSTEQAYVNFIDNLIKNYEQPFTQWLAGGPSTSVIKDDIKNIFLNVTQILPLNQELLKRLEAGVGASGGPMIGDVFADMAPYLKIYSEFGNRYQSAVDTLNKCRQDSAFTQLEADCQSKAGRQNILENLLIMPVQRIPRYVMLLEELFKATPDSQPEHARLRTAIDKVKAVAVHFNESLKKFEDAKRLLVIAQKGVEHLLAPHRVLVQELSISAEKRAMIGNAATHRGNYQLLLFNDQLVFAQKGHVSVVYPLDLVWVDASGTFVNTAPLEIGLVVPLATYTIKLSSNSNLQTKTELVKNLTAAVAEYQRKNPPAEAPPQSPHSVQNARASSIMPTVRFGRYELGIGVVFDGWWNWGKFHLRGSYECHGSLYIGEWDNGVKVGRGTMQYNSGEYYDGDWSADLPNGKGQIIYLHGSTYIGEWRDGKQHGEGELQHINGDSYKGSWKEGLPHGQGIFKTKSSVREGTWSAGKLLGYGTELHSKGWKYAGYWVSGKFEGRGVMHYADGTTYEGAWKEGLRHGIGKLIERAPNQKTVTMSIIAEPTANGGAEGIVVYEGDWLNDKHEGKGTERYPDGGVYTGQFKDGRRQGNGTYTLDLSEGKFEKYEGEWFADRKQGRGVLLSTGGKFEGTFRDDRYHGLGVLTLSDGTILEGRWLLGNLEGRCVINSPHLEGSKNDTTTVMLAKEKEGVAVFGDHTQVALSPLLPMLE